MKGIIGKWMIFFLSDNNNTEENSDKDSGTVLAGKIIDVEGGFVRWQAASFGQSESAPPFESIVALDLLSHYPDQLMLFATEEAMRALMEQRFFTGSENLAYMATRGSS